MSQVSDKKQLHLLLSIRSGLLQSGLPPCLKWRFVSTLLLATPLSVTVTSDEKSRDMERVNLLGGSALYIGENRLKKKLKNKIQFMSWTIVKEQVKLNTVYSHWIMKITLKSNYGTL